MQVSSRFTIAIHIFACIDYFQKDYKITSDFLASSVNVNPVIIRKIMSQLRRCRADQCDAWNRRNHSGKTGRGDHTP